MLSFIYREWLKERILIADRIVNDFGRRGELDAEILLCCACSALAATVWPGNGIDKKRFVQLFCDFSPLTTRIKMISICALIAQLETNSRQGIADKLINRFFASPFAFYSKSSQEYGYKGSGLFASTLSDVILPDDIDVYEEKIYQIVPEICHKDVRYASYANIIYSDLRSGLVHEYELGENLSDFGMDNQRNNPSYVNFLIMPNEEEVKIIAHKHGINQEEARDSLTKTRRRLYFPYAFIRKLVDDTANSVFDFWDNTDCLYKPKPDTWWLEG